MVIRTHKKSSRVYIHTMPYEHSIITNVRLKPQSLLYPISRYDKFSKSGSRKLTPRYDKFPGLELRDLHQSVSSLPI